MWSRVLWILVSAKCKLKLFSVALGPHIVASGWHFGASGLYRTAGIYLGSWASILFKWLFKKKKSLTSSSYRTTTAGKRRLSGSLIVFSSNSSHVNCHPNAHPFCFFPITYSDIFSLGPTVNTSLTNLEINYSWKFLKATFFRFQQSYNKLLLYAKHPIMHFGEYKNMPVLRFSYLWLHNTLLQNLATYYLIVSVAQEWRRGLPGWF